ncbi:transcriptional regulator [Pseudoalteromonas sp. BSi20652]|uniref:helix-turn-helix domain-containing protein n=1 Tax=Pseudoalteromonas sp. BSi20652 TaxID=388384 RepID=UPI0002319BE4|nr:transcriptional regulator [Pseudoalteromonas sp. BSi20652]
MQLTFAEHLKERRKKAKMSREALAKKSTVPASTIKKFKVTGLISFRQLLLLWQTLDDLTRLYELTKAPTQGKNAPTSIEQALKRY